MYSKSLAALAAATLLLSGCSKTPAGPLPKLAVLRFENLTGDSSLDWMGRAASEVIGREIGAVASGVLYKTADTLGRRPLTAPGVSTELQPALLAGANRFVTGYIELGPKELRLRVVEEDATTGKAVVSATAQGPLLAACQTIGRTLASQPKPYPTASETALRDYIEGDENPANSAERYREAIAADPKYPEPYLALAQAALAQADGAAAKRILDDARAHQIDAASLAKLEFISASLSGDASARIAAVKKLTEADPTDANSWNVLGEAEMLAHRFPEAAKAFASGGALSRPDLLNSSGYAWMFAGDEAKARAAILDYQKAVPKDANAVDSEGDIDFYFGRFADAEKAYQRALALDSQFNQGLDAWKAAHARLMTGDVSGANQLFSAYRRGREKAKDLSLPYRAARWQFLTGDLTGALDTMHQLAATASNPQLRAVALCQTAIWELRMDRRADAVRDAQAALRLQQNQVSITAALVLFAAQPFSSVAQLEQNSDREFHGTGAAVFRPMAIGYALLFAKRYPDAVPIWKKIYESANPNDQNAAFLYAKALVESGHANDASGIVKTNPIPNGNLTPNFEALYFPDFLRWRGETAVYAKLAGNTAAPAK